jgi:two-component system response regulator PilR (NtrC family)
VLRSRQAPPVAAGDIPQDGLQLDRVLADVERSYIEKALDRTGGVRKTAAKLLGITFRSLRYRLEKLGFDVGADGGEGAAEAGGEGAGEGFAAGRDPDDGGQGGA